MKTLGNILWHFPFFGFLKALSNLIAGAICCLTIVLIPVGLGWFQLAKYQMLPFDRALISRSELALLNGEEYSPGTFMAILNVIARILFFIPGCFMCVAYALLMIGEFISIVGIPVGIAESRALSTYFNPINKVCVPVEVADKIKEIKAQKTVGNYSGEQ